MPSPSAQHLKTIIDSVIFENHSELITAEAFNALLKLMVDFSDTGSGGGGGGSLSSFVFGGAITPASANNHLDANGVLVIALTEGVYTNYLDISNTQISMGNNDLFLFIYKQPNQNKWNKIAIPKQSAGVQSFPITDYTLMGEIDGTNTTFFTTQNFEESTLQVYTNGVRRRRNLDYNADFSGSSIFNKIEFVVPPVAVPVEDSLIATYIIKP